MHDNSTFVIGSSESLQTGVGRLTHIAHSTIRQRDFWPELEQHAQQSPKQVRLMRQGWSFVNKIRTVFANYRMCAIEQQNFS
jgi:hypothetical protein